MTKHDEPLPIIEAQPTDEPLACLKINRSWLPYIIGILRPMKFPEFWGGTLEENRAMRFKAQALMDIFALAEEDCGMSDCCQDPVVLTRLAADMSTIEQSTDGGVSWHPAPSDVRIQLPSIPNPVDLGLITKCQSAGAMAQTVKNGIDKIKNSDLQGLSFVDLCIILVGAILAALVSAALAPEFLLYLVPVVIGIGRAILALGVQAWSDQFTTEVIHTLQCCFFCTLGDDGQFTAQQFENAKALILVKLPGGNDVLGVARNLVDQINVIGRLQLNFAGLLGTGQEFDCSDCFCGCDWSTWSIWIAGGSLVSKDASQITVQATLGQNDFYYASIKSAHPADCCCNVIITTTPGTNLSPVGANPCGSQQFDESTLDFSSIGGSHNAWAIKAPTPFAATWTSTDPCA